MGFPIWRLGLPALLAMALPTAVLAETGLQRQELAAALRQLDGLERLIRHSEANTPIAAGESYYFDYPRLLADLVQVRAGVQAYLTPSRAQPRDVTDVAHNPACRGRGKLLQSTRQQ